MGCCGGRKARERGRSLRNSSAGAGSPAGAQASAGASPRSPRGGLEFLRRPPIRGRLNTPVAAPSLAGNGAGLGQRGKS